MRESLKAILQLSLIVALILAVTSWFITQIPPEVEWTLRIGGASMSVFLIWVLFRHALKKETLPDHLGQITPRYFERDGFCFVCVTRVINGVCWMHLFYQNRYAGVCEARVVLKPPRSFFLSRKLTEGVDAEIVAEGAAFGVYRVPWPVNAKVQGKIMVCEVGCTSSYPGGRGRLMRFKSGMRCGSPGSSAGRAAIALAGVAVGAIVISKPAKVRLRMPTQVSDSPDLQLQATNETLWRPEITTGGFPVIAVNSPNQ